MKTTLLTHAKSRIIIVLLFLTGLASSLNLNAQSTLSITPTPPHPYPQDTIFIPFGYNDTVNKFYGFVYRNIPAFNLQVGDKIRFDLRSLNDSIIRRNIHFSTANINPAPWSGTSQGVKALSWVKVVDESEIPINPYGDTILGNYELTFTAISNFSFPGGGFMIGFDSLSATAYPDPTYDWVNAWTDSSDASGNFYQTFANLPNLSTDTLDRGDYLTSAPIYIQGFEIDFQSTPPTALCKNATVYLDSTGVAIITPADVDGGSMAPEGLLSLTIKQDTFTCTNVGQQNVVILTITDSLGQQDSCRALVKVIAPPLSGTISAKLFVGGLNISCNGAADGEATASAVGGCPPYTYQWTTIPVQATATATGLSAGTYSVTVTDSKSNSIILSITLTEPNPLIVNAGANQTVYLGYAPSECANLMGTTMGGTPTYSYSWSNGATTDTTIVCPVSSTTYTLTAMDQNGCIAADEVKVCVVDVRCQKAGNAIIKGQGDKIMVCHNPGKNPKTLCIPAEAVSAHLAHGDLLGECGIDTTCNDGPGKSASKIEENHLTNDSEKNSVSIHPNPSSGDFMLTIKSSTVGTVHISISSVSGQPVSQLTGKIQDGIFQIPINMTGESNGVYIINILINQDLITKKITINK